MYGRIVALVLCATSVASALPAEDISLLQDETTSTGPLEKVRKILQDMSDQLEEDADNDADINEKMMCWCKTEDSTRTKLIADNTDKSGQLREEINSLRAKSDGLSKELDNLESEVENNQKSLDTSVALRKKELNEFTDAEKSAMSTISSLDGAQEALKKGLPSAMMQGEVELDASSPVAVTMRESMKGHRDMLWSMHNRKERKIMEQLMAHTRDIGFIQGGSSSSTINAPYDIIHGTVSSLKESFQKHLKQLQGDELDSSAAHEAAKKEKKSEIQAGLGMIDAKRSELADTDERAAAAREELDDTETALAADTEFLGKVKEQCALHEKDYATRMQTRQQEVTAVSKALEILGGDETKDLFTKTFGHTKRPKEGKLGSRGLKEFKEERETTSMRSQTNKARKKQWGTDDRYMLLQIDDEVHHESEVLPEAAKLSALASRTEAYWKAKYYMKSENAPKNKTALTTTDKHKKTAAKAAAPAKRNKLGLTAAEMAVRKGGMSGAAQGIVKMRKALELQQGEENARKDWCVEEINTVEKELDITNRKKKDQEESLELMADRIARLKDEVKHLGHDQEDADIELAKAGIDRKKSNTQFQKTVLNQLESKRTMEMAIKVLESFYGKREKKASLLRERAQVSGGFASAMDHMKKVANVLVGSQSTDELNFDAAKSEQMKTLRPGSVLLQKSKTPVSEMLKQAKKDESDAEAMINAGAAMAAQPAPKAMLQSAAAAPGDDVRPPPPPGFKSYAKGAASGGVLVQLENLVEDSEAMTKEAVEDETNSMKGYESFVAESNEATDNRQAAITNRRMEIGKLETATEETKIALRETIHLKETLRQHDIDLYGVEGCSFLIKNHEDRFMNRQGEIASLKEAEAILGVHGGDAEMTNAAHGDGKEMAPLPDAESQAEAEEEEEEEKEEAGSSDFAVVPEGVKIEGPNGETAVAKVVR